jgi:DNA-nicking Smr family endonuclease
MHKIKSLTDLKPLQQKIAQQHAQEALREAARLEAQRRTDAEKNLFIRAAGAVQPIRDPLKAHLTSEQPAPIPVQKQLDEQRVLREALSDEFDATTLLDVDDAMSFRRPGIGTDVTRKLRSGHWSIQRQIDLHGLRSDDAREALASFIRESQKNGVRCVRVVTGKGLGSPGKTPVLKGKVHSWLIQKNQVLAFVQARADEGGAGALVVLLKPV